MLTVVTANNCKQVFSLSSLIRFSLSYFLSLSRFFSLSISSLCYFLFFHETKTCVSWLWRRNSCNTRCVGGFVFVWSMTVINNSSPSTCLSSLSLPLSLFKMTLISSIPGILLREKKKRRGKRKKKRERKSGWKKVESHNLKLVTLEMIPERGKQRKEENNDCLFSVVIN